MHKLLWKRGSASPDRLQKSCVRRSIWSGSGCFLYGQQASWNHKSNLQWNRLSTNVASWSLVIGKQHFPSILKPFVCCLVDSRGREEAPFLPILLRFNIFTLLCRKGRIRSKGHALYRQQYTIPLGQRRRLKEFCFKNSPQDWCALYCDKELMKASIIEQDKKKTLIG